MNVRPYPQWNETLYSETLANGLQVFLMPKSGFTKSYATFGTKFGSKDINFQIDGRAKQTVPDGIAHFLEHKMFAKPDGDVFAKFADQGASVNAFTSFDRTNYLFSASSHLRENIETLLSFVQHPYFIEANVEKEKGIITQEILMYRDKPDWRIYFGLLASLFRVSPMRRDIAGTVDSIQKITPQLLYDCYEAFYQPSNMCFFAVGGFDPEQTMDWIREHQEKTSLRNQHVVRMEPDEPEDIETMWEEIHLPVSQPKCLIGFKQVYPRLSGDHLLRLECSLTVLYHMLYSASSTIYQTLYSEQRITPQFSFSVDVYPGYAYSMLGGDTDQPEELVRRVRELTDRSLSEGLGEDAFERVKRKCIGGLIRAFNSPATIANQFTNYYFNGSDYLQLLEVYRNLKLDDVHQVAATHLDWSKSATCVVRKR